VDLIFECRMWVFEWEDSGSNPSGMTRVYLSLSLSVCVCVWARARLLSTYIVM